MKNLLSCIIILNAWWYIPAYAQNIDLGTLLDEMADLKRLTELPDPSYRTIQFSSFDRRSTTTSDEGWFANSDGFGNEPIPGFEKVIKSPGEDGFTVPYSSKTWPLTSRYPFPKDAELSGPVT